MNIFDAFNILYREDVISDFLKSCFENSDEFLRKFLCQAHISLPDKIEYQVNNRIGLGKSIGTPDIIIVSQSSVQNDIVIIENKLGASEGLNQTNRYVSAEAREKLLHYFDLKEAQFHFIYLTLDTIATAQNEQFSLLNYQLFLSDEWTLKNEKLSLIFCDFREKLISFYKPLEKPMQSLEGQAILDQTQKVICWQSILLNAMKDSPDVQLVWGRVGGAGRLNFLFRVDKTSWRSHEDYWKTGLAKTFDIHIDTYVNLLSHSNDLLNDITIRFETNPYTPHRNIQNDEQYEKFLLNKALFTEYLSEAMRTNRIEFKTRNNKLMVMTVPLVKSTLKENIDDYHYKIHTMMQVVDAAVERLKKEMSVKSLF